MEFFFDMVIISFCLEYNISFNDVINLTECNQGIFTKSFFWGYVMNFYIAVLKAEN
jgi:hypothetical protein